MAPRGRPPQRLSRMHAAVDAMKPLGFDAKLIQKTVNSLLRVYGGPSGWPFIEADAYKVLLDRILEDQAEEEKNDDNNEDEMDGHVSPAGSNDAGPSHQPGAEDADPSHQPGAEDAATQRIEPRVNGIALSRNSNDAATPRIETGVNGIAPSRNSSDAATPRIEIWMNSIAPSRNSSDAATTTSAAAADPMYTTTAASPASCSSVPPRHTRWKRPCNGWLSDSDDEEEPRVFVRLDPAVEPKKDTRNRILQYQKRNKRWDGRS